VDQGEGTSSHFKKKKKNDKRRFDNNFVAVMECKMLHQKGTDQGPLREAPECTVPKSRGPRQAHT
jgi:hypothetical protein